MAYEKLLNEIYAAVSLKYLWAEYKPVFIKSESPDWINETMDFGLEVSQALMPDDGKTESFIEQYLGCQKESLPQSAIGTSAGISEKSRVSIRQEVGKTKCQLQEQTL